MPHQTKPPLAPSHAFGIALFAYLLYTIGDSLGKWLQTDYAAAQILVVINLVGLAVVLVAAIKIRGFKNCLKSKKWPLHVVRSTCTAISTILVLYALKRLPLSDFYGIVFLNPVWVAIISRIFLKQHVPASRWAAVFVGFIGVAIIAGTQFASFNLGAFAALLASILSATAALLARKIGGNEPPMNFSIATHIAMILFNIPLLLMSPIVPITQGDIGLMAIYGTTLTVAMMCIALVFSRAQVVSQVAPLQYTQMIWGVLFGWLVFDHAVTLQVVAGSALVMGAGFYILHSLHRGRIMTH